MRVRRLALFIEEDLRQGTQWSVFEPNDELLWAAIRLNGGAFNTETRPVNTLIQAVTGSLHGAPLRRCSMSSAGHAC